MLNFLLSGIGFLLYAYIKFTKSKIFYPSVIFSFMWGANCVITALILCGFVENLYLADYYTYRYMDGYILYFTGASILAFILAHKFLPGDDVNLKFDIRFLNRLLLKYHWIMWLNFLGGILRIILMINMVGFNNVMDYRIAANEMMNTGEGSVGFIFRITAYIQMLANFYVALYGFQTGFETIDLKKTLQIFILYAPTQMATGGRLFILYFLMFYFGSFLLARGLSMHIKPRAFLLTSEKKTVTIAIACLLSLVSIIAIARQDGLGEGKESALAKFSYITEGSLASEHYMRFYPPDEIIIDQGYHLFTGKSKSYLNFRGYLNSTYMSSIVICIIIPLYTSFGYWGSIIIWTVIAFILELWSIKCLRNLTVIRFFIFLTIIKIFYESVMSNPIAGNIPVYELIIILTLFYKPLFGRLETS